MDSRDLPPAAASGADERRSQLEAFVEAYWVDREADAVRPLADYLARFPGDDVAIAEEYLALERDEEPAASSGFDGEPGLGLSLTGGPERIGPYRIVREIGRGGQGEVYLAEDSRLKRKVALKVLSTMGPISEPHLGRFRREAEVASRLDDPGICTVFEAGDADGLPFIAMRYVVGETLAVKVHAATTDGHVGAIPLGTAAGRSDASDANASDTRNDVMRLVHLFERAARSLDHAHRAGIIHRDIKPGNIIVTPEGDPVLVDFGLARDEESDQLTLTVSGDLFGTPAYMSPEQISGGRAPADARSDIYGLGVTLFECLTLERPFDGATRETLFQNILNKPAPDPSRLNRDVPADLGTVVRIAMEKSPDHRYDSALALADDLRRVRLREPIRARPAGPLVRLQRWMQRNPALATAVFGLFLVLTAGFTVSLILLAQVNRAFGDLGEKKQEADAALEALDKQLSRSDGYRLTHESRDAAPVDPALSLLLAIEAAGRAPGQHSDSALRGALAVLREERTLEADFGAIRRLAFSPDGRRLLAVAPHRASRSWRVDTGAVLADEKGAQEFRPGGNLAPAPAAFRITADADRPRLEGRGLRVPLAAGHAAAAVAGRATWSRAAGRVAVPLRDRRVLLLDAADGRVVREITPESPGHGQDPPVEVAFDPVGGRLAVSGARQVRLFDAATGKGLTAPDVHVDARPPFAWSADGRRLAATAPENAVVVWDLSPGGRRTLLEGHRAPIAAISFSADGTRVATASRDETGRIWDLAAAKTVAVLRGHHKALTAIALSPDASRAATAAADGTVRLWRAEPRVRPRIPSGNLLRAVLDPTATRVLLPGDDASGTALLVDAATAKTHHRLAGHAGAVRMARFGPTGARAVTYAEDRIARVWSLAGGKRIGRIEGFRRMPHLACLSPEGRRLLTVAGRNAALWDVAEGRRVAELAGHDKTITWAEFSPDGARVATASDDGTARVWRAADGAAVTVCRGHRALVFPARFSPTGDTLLTASSDGTARLWDPATGRPRKVLARHRAAITDARFDAAGDRVLTLCTDGTARLWDARTGRPHLALSHGDEDLNAGHFGPRGRHVATAAGGSIHLWDAETGDLKAVIAHGAPLHDLAFTADGETVVSLGRDGTLRRWPVDPLPRAKRRRPRGLTQAERERHRVGPIVWVDD